MAKRWSSSAHVWRLRAGSVRVLLVISFAPGAMACRRDRLLLAFAIPLIVIVTAQASCRGACQFRRRDYVSAKRPRYGTLVREARAVAQGLAGAASAILAALGLATAAACSFRLPGGNDHSHDAGWRALAKETAAVLPKPARRSGLSGPC